MKGINVEVKGNFAYTESLIKRKNATELKRILHELGTYGVECLSDATPKSSGKTANCWHYRIVESKTSKWTIEFYNDNIENGLLIAALLYTGHMTVNGTHVIGKDYITPAMNKVIEKMQELLMKK